ncbi:hypothetical protein [Corynebacterium felinum]|uniref:HTH crp-type domain-containing protein n=1 Tax=Corynebacterium felinum TaxID=131318 RepID=A0ABU2B9I9_9CORY|nr:hypothetical protein [Corynebacterium felinum]MDR7354049.1 hypothetical protein [Corynebacterium felinum]
MLPLCFRENAAIPITALRLSTPVCTASIRSLLEAEGIVRATQGQDYALVHEKSYAELYD